MRSIMRVAAVAALTGLAACAHVPPPAPPPPPPPPAALPPPPPPPTPPPPPSPSPSVGGGQFSGAGYTSILVIGSNAASFRYIRQDLFYHLQVASGPAGTSEEERRLAKVRADNLNFAPQPTGSNYRLKAGSTYLFFPECRDGAKWDRTALARGGDRQVTVICPQ